VPRRRALLEVALGPELSEAGVPGESSAAGGHGTTVRTRCSWPRWPCLRGRSALPVLTQGDATICWTSCAAPASCGGFDGAGSWVPCRLVATAGGEDPGSRPGLRGGGRRPGGHRSPTGPAITVAFAPTKGDARVGDPEAHRARVDRIVPSGPPARWCAGTGSAGIARRAAPPGGPEASAQCRRPGCRSGDVLALDQLGPDLDCVRA